MSFRLVPKSVTLNDIMAIISLNSVVFGTHYVKVVEDTSIISATAMYLKESSF